MTRSRSRIAAGAFNAMGEELEELDDCVAIQNTDKAVLIRHEGSDYWIPFSQMDPESEVWEKGDTGKVIIPRWLAKEKEIV